MIPHHIYVGAIGQGVFRSTDLGVTFRRACEGMPFVECDTRALLVVPGSPQTIYHGSEHGLFISQDGAESWTRLPAPLAGLEVWSLAVNGNRILVGTRPARVLASDDAGQTWWRTHSTMRPDCPRILHTRVTTILSDPDSPAHFWAGVEIDGIHESWDGGQVWQRLGEGLTSQDIHALGMLRYANGRRLFATTNRDLNLSDDEGRTWHPARLGERLPWDYTRGMSPILNQPGSMLVGCGDGPPGSVGLILRTDDGGASWTTPKMSVPLSNSTMWNFATHPADERLLYASSISGQVYRSEDGGQTWEKLGREFGEIRGLAWAPTGS